MTKTQFKITWKRAGNAPKSKTVYGVKWANHTEKYPFEAKNMEA